jgi:flagellar biogenesis protein FliO
MPKDVFALVGMLLVVVLILVLAYFCTKYLSRMKLGRLRFGGARGKMQTLDQLVLGNDHRLVLARVGASFLLLALSSAGIALLKELTEEEAALWQSEIPAESGGEASLNAPPSFRDALSAVLKQRRK